MKLIHISDLHGDMEMAERASRLIGKCIGDVDVTTSTEQQIESFIKKSCF